MEKSIDYIQDSIRNKIIEEIKYLELPTEWTPNDVIKYIIRIIDRNGNV